jgi:hypothetical protein
MGAWLKFLVTQRLSGLLQFFHVINAPALQLCICGLNYSIVRQEATCKYRHELSELRVLYCGLGVLQACTRYMLAYKACVQCLELYTSKNYSDACIIGT